MAFKPLFIDPDLQSQFDRLGYVKVHLFDTADLEAFKSHYHDQRFQGLGSKEFFVSLDNAHPDNARKVTNGIEQVLTPKAEKIFSDFQTFAGTFLVKEPGETNIVPPHQDLTLVDESMHYSANFWIPLTDVTVQNGTLGVIPGSHTILNYPRASPSPQYKAGLTEHVSELFPFVEFIDLKAGECIIFNNRLIHASAPNSTNIARVSIGIGVVQKDVPLRHYYLSPIGDKETIEVYEVDADFFNVYSNLDLLNLFLDGKSPDDLKKLGTIKNNRGYDISKEELVDKIVQLPNAKINNSLMEEIEKKRGVKETKKVQKEIDSEELVNGDHGESRTFFQKYSPRNIAREVVWRMKGKPNLN